MQNNNIIAYIKTQFKTGGMIKKIILTNTAVFAFFIILNAISGLFVVEELVNDVASYFAMPGQLGELIYKPWTIVTSMFTHTAIGHFFWNMLIFYFVSKMFVQFFGDKRLLSTYLLGGVFASFSQILAYAVFPYYQNHDPFVMMGASGAVYAVLGALIFHKPQLKVRLYFMFEVPLWALGLIFVLSSFMNLTDGSNTAHFAHLGGILFGVLSVLNTSSTNFMNKVDRIFSTKYTFKKQAKMKVYRNSDTRKMSDDQYNSNKANKQKQMNAILDKISANGYESLSKSEKDFLFKFGNE